MENLMFPRISLCAYEFNSILDLSFFIFKNLCFLMHLFGFNFLPVKYIIVKGMRNSIWILNINNFKCILFIFSSSYSYCNIKNSKERKRHEILVLFLFRPLNISFLRGATMNLYHLKLHQITFLKQVQSDVNHLYITSNNSFEYFSMKTRTNIFPEITNKFCICTFLKSTEKMKACEQRMKRLFFDKKKERKVNGK